MTHTLRFLCVLHSTAKHTETLILQWRAIENNNQGATRSQENLSSLLAKEIKIGIQSFTQNTLFFQYYTLFKYLPTKSIKMFLFLQRRTFKLRYFASYAFIFSFFIYLWFYN